MAIVLIYILVTAFLILPATAIYALVLLLLGLSQGNSGLYFTLIHLRILGVAGALIVVAIVLFFAFGKQLVVR